MKERFKESPTGRTTSQLRETVRTHWKRSWSNTKRVYKRSLKKPEGWLSLVIAVVLLPYLVRYLFPISWTLSISFLVSGLVAIYSGYIFKSPFVLIIVCVGVVLGSEAGRLFLAAGGQLKAGDYIGAAVILAFAVYVWVWSNNLKKGDIPEEPQKRKSRPFTETKQRRHKQQYV
jgi:hypothetical protein